MHECVLEYRVGKVSYDVASLLCMLMLIQVYYTYTRTI
jgi:hypothetical protein